MHAIPCTYIVNPATLRQWSLARIARQPHFRKQPWLKRPYLESNDCMILRCKDNALVCQTTPKTSHPAVIKIKTYISHIVRGSQNWQVYISRQVCSINNYSQQSVPNQMAGILRWLYFREPEQRESMILYTHNILYTHLMIVFSSVDHSDHHSLVQSEREPILEALPSVEKATVKGFFTGHLHILHMEINNQPNSTFTNASIIIHQCCDD